MTDILTTIALTSTLVLGTTPTLDCSGWWVFEVQMHAARIGDRRVKRLAKPGNPVVVLRAGDGRTWALVPGPDGLCELKHDEVTT